MLEKIKKILNINKKDSEISVYEKIDNLFDTLSKDIIDLKIGTDLVPFGDDIVEVTGRLRDEIKSECGFIIPPVRIHDICYLQENEFIVEIRDTKAAVGYVIPTKAGVTDEIYASLKTAIYENLDKIFTLEIAEKYINAVQKNNGWLVWNVTNVLSVVDIKTILSDIISKGKSIGDINYIFEKIGEQILSNGDYHDCLKRYNPHVIAKHIVKTL